MMGPYVCAYSNCRKTFPSAQELIEHGYKYHNIPLPRYKDDDDNWLKSEGDDDESVD